MRTPNLTLTASGMGPEMNAEYADQRIGTCE
jgi:hypothetical protein